MEWHNSNSPGLDIRHGSFELVEKSPPAEDICFSFDHVGFSTVTGVDVYRWLRDRMKCLLQRKH
ncbi:hypothetical protein C4D60_Mb11t04960 [Musa balbisiana]|uniref:Uncharacterized protein n=1 Tax=Musa balbisiana TaxID=52838 RepID=A0A4S8J3A1_MUSBA|nr:hypothetical protein C4D60_Mb11t04960 [Musa balbisiana]